ncbi:citrate lyase subunit beta/citryl-CoA lyase [Antricoccus suffuscus]|uniref:Citrate lyase subunit beta/citryl-CoA lyase n=1 Tax=Antricoccus suffuscus TaxID=1629062 RepID=A0A2T0ZYQ3_9ACTN|nr:citrate lyase subunit beta/citryl-CoA lyase [Antricoccus suffuscus]
MPGTRPERFAKAAASGADEIIIDLEDAVNPEDKERARDLALEGLRTTAAVVRINSVGTPWYEADLAALSGATGLRGVVLPKAESEDVIAHVVTALPPGIAILPLVESARGIQNASLIAAADGVTRLLFGNLDFALDSGITVRSDTEDELLYARSALVVASRAAGLPGPVDGPVPEINDDTLCSRRSVRALSLGFSGKLCIHPRQIPLVHQAFAPTAEEVAWATQVLVAVNGATEGAVKVDGKMIDRPVILRAENILARR